MKDINLFAFSTIFSLASLVFGNGLAADHLTNAQIQIYVISNIDNKNIGDKNSSLGIAKAIQKELLAKYHQESKITEVTIEEKSRIEKLVVNDQRSIIITAGDYGIEFLHDFVKNDSCVTLWSGHQHYEQLTKIKGKASVIILPSYVVDEQVKKSFDHEETHLVLVPGVANNIDQESLSKEYQQRSSLLKADRYVMVFIGGDAPDAKGKIKKMLPEDAFYMGKNAAILAKEQGSSIVVTNGPRTTPELLEQFKKALLAEGLTQEQFEIFDFHTGARVYNLLLSLISQKPNDIIVSGESSSMVRDLIEQSHKPIYVYQVASINEAHQKQLDFECSQGHIRLLHENQCSCEDREYVPVESVTGLVAGDIIEYLDWDF